jgi:hypothetical protein
MRKKMRKLSISFIALAASVLVLAGGKPSFGDTLIPVIYNAAGDAGNQAWTGNLAEIFSVSSPITVVALGAFDNGSPTLAATINVGIYDFGYNAAAPVGGPQAWVAQETFYPGTYTIVNGNDVYLMLSTPVTLQAGWYELDAVGFGASQPNGNTLCTVGNGTCTGNPDTGSSLNTLGGIVGTANLYNESPNNHPIYYDTYDTGTSLDVPLDNWSLGNQFSAGAFAVSPEPGTLLLLGTGLLGLAFVAFRKAKSSGQTLGM